MTSSSSPSSGSNSMNGSSLHSENSIPSYSTSHTLSVDSGSKKDVDWKGHFDLNHENETEELVDSCACALSRDILIQGNLFISTVSVGFRANILGIKTKVHFPLNTVSSILPKMTALVIPNGLEILVRDGTSYTFATLPKRDETLELLLGLWKHQAPEAYSSFLINQPENPSSSTSSFPLHLSDSPARSSVIESAAAEEKTRERSDSAQAVAEGVAEGEEKAGGEDASHPQTKADTPSFDEKCLDVRFPTTPEKIFGLMYKNDEFLRDLWEKEKFTDVKLEPWSNGKRTFSYTKPLSGSVGPSSATCFFEDEIIHEDAEGWYGVVTITKTPDVPSGKSFEVHTKTCITWEGGQNGGARVVATSKVEWSSSSMLKSVINSSSMQGQKDYNKVLSTACRSHTKTNASEFNVLTETHASGDVDDEVDSDSGSQDGEVDGEESSSFPDGVVDFLMKDPLRTTLLLFLVVSLLFNILSFARGGSSSGGGGVKMVQRRAWKGGEEVQRAMERLERIEREWEGVRVCLSAKIGAVLED